MSLISGPAGVGGSRCTEPDGADYENDYFFVEVSDLERIVISHLIQNTAFD